MLLALTSTGQTVLIIVAGLFIAWAIVTAILIPRRSPDFPSNLSVYIVATAVLFVAQMAAVVWVTSTQAVEKHAAEAGGGTTAAETTPTETAPVTTTQPAAGGQGDATAGKQVFAAAGCGSCHTLRNAGATGSVGPSLDTAKPAYELVVSRVTNGKGVMPSFKGRLDAQQIKDVAAYVSSVAGT